MKSACTRTDPSLRKYDAEQVYARLRFAKNSKFACGKCGGKHQEQYCTGALKCTHCDATGHLAAFCYARRRLSNLENPEKKVTFEFNTCQLKLPKTQRQINLVHALGAEEHISILIDSGADVIAGAKTEATARASGISKPKWERATQGKR